MTPAEHAARIREALDFYAPGESAEFPGATWGADDIGQRYDAALTSLAALEAQAARIQELEAKCRSRFLAAGQLQQRIQELEREHGGRATRDARLGSLISPVAQEAGNE